ncbi:hypothetical protein BC829DRAFT_421262 [Chytridium lagenaria]|nr:hypothetical protein BC829DRAFT_421262 [Chytridium lagenaria]
MTALSAIVPRPAVDPVTNLTPFLSPAIPIPPPLNGGGGVGVGIAGIGVGVGGAGNGVDGDGGNAGGAVNGAHGGDAGNGAHGDDAGNGGHDGRIGLGNALNNDNGVPDALAIARRELEEAAMIIRAHQDRIAALEREKQLAPPSILPHIPPATVIDIGQFIRDNDVFSTDPFTPHVSIYTQALRTFRSEATEFLRSGDRELTPTWLRSREGLFSRLTTLHDVGVDCLCLSPSQSSAWKTILNRSLFRLADGEFLPLRNELSAIISLFGWLVPNPNASLLAAAILQESRQLGNAVKITQTRRLAQTPYERPTSTYERPTSKGSMEPRSDFIPLLKSSGDSRTKPSTELNICGTANGVVIMAGIALTVVPSPALLVWCVPVFVVLFKPLPG